MLSRPTMRSYILKGQATKDLSTAKPRNDTHSKQSSCIPLGHMHGEPSLCRASACTLVGGKNEWPGAYMLGLEPRETNIFGLRAHCQAKHSCSHTAITAMKLMIQTLLGASWFVRALAAPQVTFLTFLVLGFAFVDPDGIYRAYLADGSVVDAARLTPEQLQHWLDVRAPLLSASDAENERTTYATANPQDVPEEQLLHPPDEIKPHAQIESMAEFVISPNPNPLQVTKRQVACPPMYCVYRDLACFQPRTVRECLVVGFVGWALARVSHRVTCWNTVEGH
ncbi:uncharacterized protein MYCGRDRAFT_92696 [Zymoseptoria tritici IPO323]|uniref:Uncharacterized protein n=1 Tax=Zymoseptoria tritici (strain CBS 115943 / IPO323) TaxID=336722 RepID=F9X9P7_ZYMTI|nr:uncharacterized protein MYCGRDRAFT_92696 [Zymoseptoria tritici IPO323]EGP88044.1 hypothetical protein MYCGRDRAFT_92696 [Zymoseptoria tritici IPO323]